MKRLMFAVAILLSALGCNHEKAADASPAPSAVAAATVASAVAAAAVASAAVPDSAAPVAAPAVSPAVVAAIPAEEDFEPQAATTITAANASQQLAVLEKEIRK